MIRYLLAISLLSACNDECFFEDGDCDDGQRYTAHAISAGRAQSCAATETGVICWGEGEAPVGIADELHSAGDVTCTFNVGAEAVRCAGPEPLGALFGPGDARYLGVSISATHGCAIERLTADSNTTGTLDCWGDAPMPPNMTFDGVASGNGHTCGVREGVVTCWGRNDAGQANPPAIALHGLVAADGYTCGLDIDEHIVCWGRAPTGAPSSALVQLAAADAFMCARDRDDRIACWGDPTDGRTSAPHGPFVALAVGDRHACAIDVVGYIACWGADDVGQATAP